MFSLKSLAILALAGFASAVPVDTGAVAGLVGSLPGVPGLAGGLPAVPGLAGGLPAIPGVTRRQLPPVLDGLVKDAPLPAIPGLPGLPAVPRDTSAIDHLISLVGGNVAVPNVPRAVDPSTLTGLVSGATSNIALPGAPAALPNAPVNLPVPRAESRSAVVIVKSVIADVQPAVDAITALVSVKADIQVDVVVERLGDIVDVLQGAIAEVQLIVANPVGFVTSVEELATVLGLLIVVITNVLFLVFSVPALATATVAGLIATIGGLLATLLGLIIPLAVGILAFLIPTILRVVSFLYILNLRAIVQVLGLPDLF